MSGASGDLDLSTRLDVRVDPDAPPVDWDEAVAEFLVSYVRRRDASQSDGPDFSEADER